MTSKLVIADGHHRYETALNFRNECRESAGKSESEAPYEFVMMTFVNVNDPGLFVLPTHRVVHSLKSFSVDEFRKSAGEIFEGRGCRRLSLMPRRRRLFCASAANKGTVLLAVTAQGNLLLHSRKDREFEIPRWTFRTAEVARRRRACINACSRESSSSRKNQFGTSRTCRTPRCGGSARPGAKRERRMSHS